MKKRILSIFLTLCMVLTLLPAITPKANAAEYTLDSVISDKTLKVFQRVATAPVRGESSPVTIASNYSFNGYSYSYNSVVGSVGNLNFYNNVPYFITLGRNSQGKLMTRGDTGSVSTVYINSEMTYSQCVFTIESNGQISVKANEYSADQGRWYYMTHPVESNRGVDTFYQTGLSTIGYYYTSTTPMTFDPNSVIWGSLATAVNSSSGAVNKPTDSLAVYNVDGNTVKAKIDNYAVAYNINSDGNHTFATGKNTLYYSWGGFKSANYSISKLDFSVKNAGSVVSGFNGTLTLKQGGTKVSDLTFASGAATAYVPSGNYSLWNGTVDTGVTITADSGAIDVNQYTVSVGSGAHMSGAYINNSGNNSYSGLNGASVAISGGTAATGYQFDKWTVDTGTTPTWETGKSAADKNQTITMNGAATLTATAKLNAPTVTVTGKNGAGTTALSTTYEDTITLTATSSHALSSGLTYTYQWYKGGTDDSNKLSGKTDTTLTLSNVSDSGDYYCKVTAVNQDATPMTASGLSSKTTVTIGQKPVALTVSGTSQTYQPGTPRSITITGTGTALSASDFTVKYYKVDEDNGVLSSTTPVVNAVSTGRYLYVIDFAAAQQNYKFSDKFTVSSGNTALPNIAVNDNVGFLDIKAGTEQQQPISFDSGTVNKYVTDSSFKNVLTNPNGTTAVYQSSNTSVATVAPDGTVTIKASGSTTITATSSKDGTAQVYASYTLNVSKESITVTIPDKSVIYGDAMPYADASVLSFSKPIGDADYASTALSFSGYTQGRSVGQYTITAKGLSSNKYSFIYESGTLTVTPRILTASNFSVTAQGKAYDGTKDAALSVTVSDLYGSDTLGATISGSFQDAGVGAGKTVNYAITGLTGAKALNYELKDGSISGDTAATISQAAVTVSCQSQSANFDGEAKTIPLTAYVDGKLFTAYQVTYNGSTTPPSAVGDYTIGIDLTDKTNYTVNPFIATLTIKTAGQDSFDVTGVPDTVTYGDADFKLSAVGNTMGSIVTYEVASGNDFASVSGDTVKILKPGTVIVTATSKLSGYADKTKTVTFTVKKKAVTVTAQDQTMTYGDAFSTVTNGYTVLGSVTGNDVTGNAAYATTYTEAKGAGSYLITPSGLTSEYYSFIYEPGTLTVNPKSLTADDFSVSVKDKEYDGTTSADFTITVNAVSVDTLSAVYSGSFGSSNAAYNVSASCKITGVTGSKADSYVVNSAISKSATARISPMPITFTFGTTTYLYDGQQKAVTVSAVDSKNRVFSDFTVRYDDSATPPSAVGDYAVKAVLANGTNYTTSSNTAILTITKGNVVVWASSGTSQKYDGTAKYITAMSAPNVPTVVTYYAITNEDKVSDIVSAPTAVGRYLYIITQTDPNYKIKNAVEVSSGDAVATLTGSNFGILEIAENVQPTLSFDNPLVNATYGDLSFIKTPSGGAVGAAITYMSSDESIVTVDNNGRVTIVKPGLATITATAQKDGFGDVKATYAVQIAKKAVTLSLDAETSVTYKGENWIVPYHLAGDIDGNKIVVEDIGFTYTDQSDPNKHTPKNAGTYLATAQVKADNEYYTSGQTTGILKITPAALTVTADDKTITYGDIAPAYTVSYTPIGGDTFGCLNGTAAFDCSYKQFDNKGSYSITPSALSSPNYEITFKAGTLTVNPKTVTLSWSKDSLPYTGIIQSINASVGGLVNSDNVNVSSYTGNMQKDVSTGYIAEVTAIDNANYTLTGSSNITHSWSITAVAPSIELSNLSSESTGSPILIGAAKVTGVSNDGDISSQYNVTYTYYTDAARQNQTTADDGAAVNGGAPSKSGTYYVNAEIPAQGNYINASAAATLTIYAPSNGGGVGGGTVIVTPTQPDVVIPKIIGGDITLNPSKPTEGDNVIITVSPDKGYTDGGVTVTDKDGNNIPVNKKSDGTYSFTMPNVAINVTPKFDKETVKNPFKDVSENAYYYEAVLWAVEKGITGGTGEDTFGPNLTSTRAQTVTFLWRSMGSPEPSTTNNPFTDMSSDAYYYKAVLWAIEKGITVGTSSTTFSPDSTVTRSQAVTFMWRAAGKSSAGATNLFGDVESDAYYSDAVLWAVSQGITSGTGASTFSPADGCTRAQIVTFLYRYLGK